MRRRIVGIMICFMLFGFVVLLARLFLLQVAHGEEYQARAAQQQTRSTTLGANRGTIYDRNGAVLAKSATVWNVCLSPADITPEDLPVMAKMLGEILDVSPEYIIEQGSDRKSYYKRIARRIDLETRTEVLEYLDANDVDGVFFEEDTKRYYPYGSLASTVLGFTNYDNAGAYGLEAKYNKELSGTPGMVVSAKNAWGSDMPFKYQQRNEASDGNSLVLTLDEGIQHFVEKHLETAIVEHSIGNRACGIVMDITTGEILAMATKGDFDPNDPYTLQDEAAVLELEEYEKEHPEGTEEYNNKLEELWFDQWRNKAISDPYEPGSVFKIITAATALDNGAVTLNDSFYCGGSITVSDRRIGCHKREGHGALNFMEGMQHSCNPVFITIGQRVGAAAMYDYIGNFGLREPTGIDLPGEAEGIHHSLSTLSKEGMVELSSTSFGQSFKVTAIEMITAAGAAVNGGQLMQPYIVKQVRDSEGNVISTTQPTVKRQVVSAETSQTIQYLVEKVVDGGSGRYAAVPGYRIGGKTGTSEILDQAGSEKNILSFIGFAPMEDPKYAVLVVLDEPKLDNVFGSVIAAPVVGAIFQEMLPYLGIEPNYTEEELAETEVEVPYLIGQKPHDAQAELTIRGLQTRIAGEGPEVLQQIPQSGRKMPKGTTVTLYTSETELDEDVEIPNVVGLTAQEANRVLATENGLNVELRGAVKDGVQAVVTEQWPLAGAQAKTGDIVVITLTEQQEEPAAETALQQPASSSGAGGEADESNSRT